MPMDIDGLQIEITDNSEQAVDGLDALAQSLEGLKKVTGDLSKTLDRVNFDKFGEQMKKLSSALQPLQGFKTQAGGVISALRNFRKTADDFNKFSGFDQFSSQMQLLADSLQPLSNISTKLGATLNALSQVSTINKNLDSVDFDAFGLKITTLTQSLTPLGSIHSKLGATLNQLSRFGQVTQQLDMVLRESNVSLNIQMLVKALEPLTTLGKSTLGSILNQLKKLPEVMSQLSSIDMDAFTTQVERVVIAVKPLATEMEKVASGFSAFPARIQKLITQNERLSAVNSKLGKSFNLLGVRIKSVYGKMALLLLTGRKLANIFADWVGESNKYVENLNLFRVSMRGAADEALNYAEKVREAFGIDPSEWIRFQAVFQNMATGFGITADKATIMSKTLTQLGYDLATIFNVDYATAMEKLESAIAGQPRPMREWGFDMSEATLKLVAMNHGLEDNVETMTQYEKSQLRFIQLMETAKAQGILGNFAREIHTPANAMRILNQQLVFFKRSLGDMLIPVLMKVLPYLQAFVILMTDIARAVANLVGFTLPTIDYSGLNDLTNGANGAADGLENTDDAAKQLKKTLMGFDEINLLDDLDALSANKDLGIDLSQYDYDFIGDTVNEQVNSIVRKLEPTFTWIKENLNTILDIVKTIGIAFAAWEIAKISVKLIDALGNFKKTEIDPLTKITTGLTLIITGIAMEFSGAKIIGAGKAELIDYIKTALGSALGIAGSLLVFGTGPIGWTIGISVTLITLIAGIEIGKNEKIAEMTKNAFYKGGMGIVISDVVIEFKKVNLSITEDMESVIKNQQAIKKLKDYASEIVKSIEKIGTSWNQGITDTDTAINELTGLFEELKTGTKTILDEVYNNIVEAISGAFGVALIEAGYSIPELLKMLGKIKGESEANIVSISNQMEDLNTKYSEGAIGIQEYKDKYNDLMKQMTNIIQLGADTNNVFTNIKDNLSDIDWKSDNAMNEAFIAISESVKTSKSKVDEYYSGLIENLKTLRATTTDPEYQVQLDDMIRIADGASDAQKTQIDANLVELFDYMQQDIILKSAAVVQNATDEWNKMSWLEKWFSGGSEAAYVAKALMNYQTNIVDPISEKMDISMDELGIEGSTFAHDAMQDILTYMFDYNINGAGLYVSSFSETLDADTYEMLQKYGINANQWANTAGIKLTSGLLKGTQSELEVNKPQIIKDFEIAGNEISNGLLKGVAEQEEQNKPWYKKLWDTFVNTFKWIFGINSPSTVFKGFGQNIMQGLLDGMKGWDLDFKKIFKGIVNVGIEMFNKFISWLNDTMSFSWDDKYIAGVKVLSGGSIRFVNIPQIPKLYAQGGFPSSGELFIAREAGAEMVGSIGRKTAVANNDQIVEAVSQGVYEAVTMAMKLNSNNNDDSRDIVLNIDGRTFARTMLQKINEEALRLGYESILKYKEA